MEGEMRSGSDGRFALAAKDSAGMTGAQAVPRPDAYRADGAPTDSGQYRLISEVTAWREAKLEVDEQDPFFFDHPLDHVPGTMLLFGLLDIVRTEAGPELGLKAAGRLRLDVEFPRFCELGGPIRLACSKVAPDGIADQDSRIWAMRAEQDGAVVCAGSLELSRASQSFPVAGCRQGSGAARGLVDETPESPAAGPAVHRVNSENIMIGKPATDAHGMVWVPLLLPRATYLRSRSPYRKRSPEEIIEAVRQFAVLQEAGNEPDQTQLIMRALHADLPCGTPRIPLLLRGVKGERRGSRTSRVIDLMAPPLTEAIGQFMVSGWNVSKAAYGRVRGFKK
jgi:hypothetical protein